MQRQIGFATIVLWSLASSVSAADDLSVEFYSYTRESLFPSALIATALVDWEPEAQKAEDHRSFTESNEAIPLYGDDNGWLGIRFDGLPEEAKVEVVLRIDGILKPSKWSGRLKPGHTTALVMPKAAWEYDKLHTVREERPVNVEYTVKVNGKTVSEATEICVLKSINDCPFYVFADEEGSAEGMDDISVVFAAYVNENHPYIKDVLQDALQLGIVDGFTGYQSGRPEEVIAQVYAVWTALHEQGVSYSDISTTTPSTTVACQTVRFLDESIESQQANCVDGSVLLASVLRKIGLNVHLVMVPGHCLLAFDLDAEGTMLMGLETTLLGDVSENSPDEYPDVLDELPEIDSTTSFPSFASAIVSGTNTVLQNAEKIDAGDDPNTQIISVEKARKIGIRPIAMKQALQP
jgi:hypothetical protein